MWAGVSRATKALSTERAQDDRGVVDVGLEEPDILTGRGGQCPGPLDRRGTEVQPPARQRAARVS